MPERNQIAAYLASVAHRTIVFDGITQHGLATYSSALTPSAGIAWVQQYQRTSGATPFQARDITGAAAYISCEAAGAGGLKIHYLDGAAHSGNTGTYTTDAGADSAGFRLACASVVAGSGVDLTARGYGIDGARSVTANLPSAELTDDLDRWYVMAGQGPSGRVAGLWARGALWIDGGISAAELAMLYGDGTLATDWRTAISGRPPHGYWRAWYAAEDGSTLSIPDAMGGPSLIITAASAADISTTIPTGVA